VTCGDKLWSFSSPFRHSDTVVSDGTQRQIMVILCLLSSRGGGPDDIRRQIMVIPLTFSPFRHSCVRWHVETNYGHSATFVIQRRWARWHAEKNYGHSAQLFAIQTQSCPMARKEKLWSFCVFCHPEAASPMTCEDKLWSFRSPFRHSDTVVSDGTQR